jgi:23S rRNA (adenine2503-C2)-methyltransferase
MAKQKKLRITEGSDGTLKLNIALNSTETTETILLNNNNDTSPNVLCVSSQIGCMRRCSFCASGNTGFIRNLTQDEIQMQVETTKLLSPDFIRKGFQIAFMGIGEPFDNYLNVFSVINRMFDSYETLYKTSISTILPFVPTNLHHLLAKKVGQIHFQFSLHSPFANEREALLKHKSIPTDTLINLMDKIGNSANDEYCINYTLLNEINDTDIHAKQLVKILTGKNCHVKLSYYNPIFTNSHDFISSSNIEYFYSVLVKGGLRAHKFPSKGVDIHAGCGQLTSQISLL